MIKHAYKCTPLQDHSALYKRNIHNYIQIQNKVICWKDVPWAGSWIAAVRWHFSHEMGTGSRVEEQHDGIIFGHRRQNWPFSGVGQKWQFTSLQVFVFSSQDKRNCFSALLEHNSHCFWECETLLLAVFGEFQSLGEFKVSYNGNNTVVLSQA